MSRRLIAFSAATLFPLPFMAVGLVAGGWAGWLALAYITIFVAAFDAVLQPGPDSKDPAPWADRLSCLLAALHFVLLFGAVWSLSGRGIGLSASGIALFFAVGMFLGQVSNSNAHELIHRQARGLRWLGEWVYISLLFGHHSSAHRAVHHVHVGTPQDPNTARLNESFYRFFKRAWLGSFRAGLEVEKTRMAQKDLSPWGRQNPYLRYILGAIGMLGLSFVIAGVKGVVIHLLLATYAQMQLMLSDYVQHYGLTRARREDGSYEPVDARHSWNAPHVLSNLWMLNAPRHSDHHAHPAKPYPELTLPAADRAPTLPYALPVMAGIALYPKLWKKVMNARVAVWQNQPAAPMP